MRSALEALRAVPGCVPRKRHGTAFAIAGDPDLYGTVNGRHWELEIKRPGERPTTIQLRRLEEWRQGGAITGVATSADEAVAIVTGAAA